MHICNNQIQIKMHIDECYIIGYYSKIELKKNSYLKNIYK